MLKAVNIGENLVLSDKPFQILGAAIEKDFSAMTRECAVETHLSLTVTYRS